MGRQAFWDTHGKSGTFLQIQPRLLQHLIRRSWIHWVLIHQKTHHHMWWVRTKHQIRTRDASQDRQPEIQSSPVRNRRTSVEMVCISTKEEDSHLPSALGSDGQSWLSSQFRTAARIALLERDREEQLLAAHSEDHQRWKKMWFLSINVYFLVYRIRRKDDRGQTRRDDEDLRWFWLHMDPADKFIGDRNL